MVKAIKVIYIHIGTRINNASNDPRGINGGGGGKSPDARKILLFEPINKSMLVSLLLHRRRINFEISSIIENVIVLIEI